MLPEAAEHQQVSDDGLSQADDDSAWLSYSSEDESNREHGETQAIGEQDHFGQNDSSLPVENDFARPSASADKRFGCRLDIDEAYAKGGQHPGLILDQSPEEDGCEDSMSGMTISTDSNYLSEGERQYLGLRGRPLHRLWDSMARSVSFLCNRSWSLSPSRMRSLHVYSLTHDERARAIIWDRRLVKYVEGSRRASYPRIKLQRPHLYAQRDKRHATSYSEDDSGASFGVDDVEPEEQLCQVCRGINAENLASGYEHLKLCDLVDSAFVCRLCHRLKQEISRWGRKLSFSDRYTMILIREVLVVKDSQTDKSVLRFDFPYFTNEDDPAVHYGVRSRRWLTTTKSEKSFEIARTWLDECLKCKGGHVIDEERFDSESVSSSASWLASASSSSDARSQDEISQNVVFEQLAAERPSRLIDLHPENTGPGVVKLVPSLHSSCEYMTLSYCWGKHPNPAWVTTRENIQKRLESFSRSELPATLFDALVIADRLGARYLWIDALCIVQDDFGDWEFEGGRMAGIYRGAVLGISASSSASSVDGIFNERSSSHFERFRGTIVRIDGSVNIHGTNRNSERCKSTLYFHPKMMHKDLVPGGPMQRYIERGPLSGRAWVLQERLLSPRILHYTRDQLLWQCEHCATLEDRLFRYPGESYRLKQDVLRTLEQRLDVSEVRELWYKKIVPVYSKLKLTYGSDKLIAISALARAVCLNHPDVYLAGLWSESLIHGLLWRRDGPGCKSSEYRCPSWSWASQDSEVWFVFGEERSKFDCKVVDFDVETDGSNAMGKVVGGFIKLRARALDGVVMKIVDSDDDADDGDYDDEEVAGDDDPEHRLEHRLVLWDGKRPFICGAYMDDDDIKVKRVVCVHIGGDRGLLLRLVASEAGVYERVGLTGWFVFGDRYRRNLVSSWPSRTITIR